MGYVVVCTKFKTVNISFTTWLRRCCGVVAKWLLWTLVDIIAALDIHHKPQGFSFLLMFMYRKILIEHVMV